jgi:hypothetical protein
VTDGLRFGLGSDWGKKDCIILIPGLLDFLELLGLLGLLLACMNWASSRPITWVN